MEEQKISFSEYKTYKDCPYQHYLKYVLGYKEPMNEHLVFGSILHYCIEDVLNGVEFDYYKNLYKKHLNYIYENEYVSPYVKMSKREQNMVVKILKQFDWDKYKNNIFEIEKKVKLPIYFWQEKDIQLIFKGYIDLIQLVINENGLHITDWKSAKYPWKLDKKLKDPDFLTQLKLYKYAISYIYNYPLEKIGTSFVTLVKEGEPKIQEYEFDIKNDDIYETINTFINVTKNVITTNKNNLKKARHNKDKKWKCRFCPFDGNKCTFRVNEIPK